jgi:hypothetical protein
MPRFVNVLVRGLLLLLIVAGILLFYARYVEPNRLRVEEVTVSSAHVSEAADGLRILVFADTHFGPYYTTEDFERVLSAVEDAKPDLLFFLGDLIDHYSRYSENGDARWISDVLSQMEAPYGKFAVYGNHDYGGGAESKYPTVLSDGGFQLLTNETARLPDLGLTIIGIDDVLIGYGDPEVAAAAQDDSFNIILTHAPDIADRVISYPADLILAGHTHGRQVDLRFFDDLVLPPYGKKYISGLYSLPGERAPQLYVTSGLGTTKLPLRFLSVPEVTLITLSSS